MNGQQPDNGPFVGDTDPDMVFLLDVSSARQAPDAIASMRENLLLV